MSSTDSPVNSSSLPSRYTALAALTLVGVMLTGVWQIMGAVTQPDGLEFPRTWLDFREGRTTGTLEKQLDHKLPARASLIAVANSVRYLLVGGAGEQVRLGQNGWLFLTDELRFESDGPAHLQIRADLLATAAGALKQQGIQLVVVLVPDKARVYAKQLTSRQYPTYNQSRYQDALDALNVRHVAVVDLLNPLTQARADGDVYYHSDTHWNQRGARVAANAVATALQQHGIELEPTTFASSTDTSAATERPGDLIHLMGLDHMPNTLRPAPDHEIPLVTRQTSADSAAGGLFGDVSVPVALTGTSYSLRGNFHGFLQEALSAKVLNAAKDGGGFLQATTAYLKDESFQSAKPKVLVWEVPERFLLTKLEGEEKWLEQVGLRR